jgi:hypothetical protein
MIHETEPSTVAVGSELKSSEAVRMTWLVTVSHVSALQTFTVLANAYSYSAVFNI